MQKKKMLVIQHVVSLGDTYVSVHEADSAVIATELLEVYASGRGDGRGSYPYYVDVIIDGEDIYIPLNLEETDVISSIYEPY